MKFFFMALTMLAVSAPCFAKETGQAAPSRTPFTCLTTDPVCAELKTIPPMDTFSEHLIFERVVDGDTFVASGRKVRLWGIDAPEKHTPAFFASGWLLQGLMKDGDLSCKLIELDRYQREVMHCLIEGLDIGAMMVKMGMARDYPKYSGGFYQREQQQAKTANRGIWKLGNHEKSPKQ